jgi:hypothetical protein
MGGGLVIAAVSIFWLQRGLTFIWDEFIWMENAGLRDVGFYFHPYGSHLIAFPYFIYKAVLELFGASYTAYSIIQVIGLSAAAALVYVYAKRRIGPILALAPAIVLLFLGSSWQVLLQPMIGIQFLCAVVPGLGAILLVERNERRADIAACVLFCLAVSGFEQALAFLAGATVAIALSPNWKRRIWIVAIPLLGYVAWHVWATRFEPATVHLSNIPLLPVYVVDALAAVSNALVGLNPLFAPGPWTLLRLERSDINIISEGVVFLVLEVLIVCGAVWLIRQRGPVPKTFWPAVAMLLALLGGMGLVFEPGRTPFENRYLYTGALLLLLVLVEIFKGMKATPATVAVAFALTFAAVFGNLAEFHEGRQRLDHYQKFARADLAVVQLAGHHGNQYFDPNVDASGLTPPGLWAETGTWSEVAHRFGSPANSISELRRQPESVRESADGVAAIALELKLAKATMTNSRQCHRASVSRAAGAEIALPSGGAILKPNRTTEVELRRWADEFTVGLGVTEGGEAAMLRIHPDPATGVPWRLRFAQSGSVTVCSIR